ncbi:hypothetical protein AB0M96_36775, partial [Streptomyces sp. NPDC051098]
MTGVKRMFSAPDPGRLRLRVSLRAVLGIGLAVAAAEGAGLSLVASITGGLAALLALFTVGDATVRRQAVTNLDRTIRSVKRHMGTDWKIEHDGK